MSGQGTPPITGDMTSRQMYWALAALYLLHVLIIALYAYDVFPQFEHIRPGRLWFYHGGDQEPYFDIARSLLSWTPSRVPYTLGYPILLIPFVLVLHPNSSYDLVEPVSAFWSLAMFPIAQLLLGRLTEYLTGFRCLAVLAVGAWTILPVAVFLAFRAIDNPTMAEAGSIPLTWAQMLSDGPATFLILLTMFMFVRVSLSGAPDHHYAAIGFIAGFAMMVRVTAVFSLAAILLAMLIQRRVVPAAMLTGGAGLGFLPQAIYNTWFFGAPFQFGYVLLDKLDASTQFRLQNILLGASQVWRVLGVVAPIAVAGGLIVIAAGLRFMSLRSRAGAAVIGFWLAGYVVFHSVYYYSWTGIMVRYLMPAYPAAAMIFAAAFGPACVRRLAHVRPT